MITLNLVPQTEKETYQTEISRRFVVFFSIGCFVIFLAFVGLLIVSYLFIYFQIGPETKRLEVEKQTEKAKKVAEFEKQIKDINTKLNTTLSAKKQIIPAMIILEETFSAINSGSYLKNIIYDKNTSAVSIKGFARTRNDALKMEENIKKNPLFTELNSPYSNFLKQTNIDFIFDFKISK